MASYLDCLQVIPVYRRDTSHYLRNQMYVGRRSSVVAEIVAVATLCSARSANGSPHMHRS